MSQYLVAVLDGTKARFFTLNPDGVNAYEAGPHLVEQKSLCNAEKELHGQDLWANTKTGRNRSSSGSGHNYDDHRSNHMVEFERRVAQSVTNHIAELSRTYLTRHLILVAEPQILGILRNAMSSNLSQQLAIHQIAKDLCHFRAREIHDYLADQSLLPAFNRPGL
jgi:protein required for attachment to host cells